MKIIVQQNELDKAISRVKGAIDTAKNVIDIVEGIKLTTDGNNLKVRGTDLEIEITTAIPVTVQEEGEVVIPSNEIYKLVKELPNEDITIYTDDNKVKIETDNSKFTLSSYNADEYPQPMEVEKDTHFEIEPKILKEMISKLNFSCANDDTQPHLKGVLLDITEDNIIGVSTNTYRLSHYKIENTYDVETSKVILPLKSTKQIKKLLKDNEENVKITFSNDKNAKFVFDTEVLKTRIIEGRFPDYTQVMPKAYNSEVEVSTDSLKSLLKRTRIIANKASGVINIEVDKEDDLLKISAASNELGEAHERLNADIVGESMSISIDVNYLMDVVSKAVDADITSLKFTEKLNPMVVEEVNYKHIIMPVRG